LNLKSSALYAGIDDSNHGNFPEIWAAVFSNNPEDILPRKYQGRRDNLKLLTHNISFRDYRFLEVSREESERLEKSLLARVVVSLITDHRLHNHYNKLELVIDGRVTREDKKRMRESLRGFQTGANIKGICKVGNYKYPKILAIADELAHHLFCDCSREQTAQDEHKIYLLR